MNGILISIYKNYKQIYKTLKNYDIYKVLIKWKYFFIKLEIIQRIHSERSLNKAIYATRLKVARLKTNFQVYFK